MTVAVKYCGGCNPRYDRGAALEKLKKRYPDIKFEGLDLRKRAWNDSTGICRQP